jgi:hypothetical protein
LGDPISPEELVDADEFFTNPDRFNPQKRPPLWDSNLALKGSCSLTANAPQLAVLKRPADLSSR